MTAPKRDEVEAVALEAACMAFWEADEYADEKAKWDDLPAECERLGEPDHQENMRRLMRAAIAALDESRARDKGDGEGDLREKMLMAIVDNVRVTVDEEGHGFIIESVHKAIDAILAPNPPSETSEAET